MQIWKELLRLHRVSLKAAEMIDRPGSLPSQSSTMPKT